MIDSIEVFAKDVNDIEGYVYAQYKGALDGNDAAMQYEPITLRGTLTGPYCKRAQTLPTEFTFRDLGPAKFGLAEVVVPDPCTWSPDLPHLYQVDVEARRGDSVVAAYHGTIGLRRMSEQDE